MNLGLSAPFQSINLYTGLKIHRDQILVSCRNKPFLVTGKLLVCQLPSDREYLDWSVAAKLWLNIFHEQTIVCCPQNSNNVLFMMQILISPVKIIIF